MCPIYRHQGSSVDVQFEARSDVRPAEPAAYFYVFATQSQQPIGTPGAKSIGEPPLSRLAPVLLEGLRGAARDAAGAVTSNTLSSFILEKLRSTRNDQLPEIQASEHRKITFLRPVSDLPLPEDAAPGAEQPSSEPRSTSDVPIARDTKSAGRGFNFSREARDDELCLNAEGYAAVVAQLFSLAGLGEFCFAVYGHWGRGKTRLMQLVGAILAAEHGGYRTIPFSAWRYPSALRCGCTSMRNSRMRHSQPPGIEQFPSSSEQEFQRTEWPDC